MTAKGQRFRRRALRRGYKVDEVDAFLERVEGTLAGEHMGAPVAAHEVHDVVFRVRFGGYDEWQVDVYLDRVERQLAAMEEGGVAPRPPEPSRVERDERAPYGAPAREEVAYAAQPYRDAREDRAPYGPAPRGEEPAPYGPPGRDEGSYGPPAGDEPTLYRPVARDDRQPYGPPPRDGRDDRAPYGAPPRNQPPYGPPPRDEAPYGPPARDDAPYGPPLRDDPPYGAPPRDDRPGAPMPRPQRPAAAMPGGGPGHSGPVAPTMSSDPTMAMSQDPLRTQAMPRTPGGGAEGPGRHGKADMTSEIPAADSPFTPDDVHRLDQLRRTFQSRRFGSGYDPNQVNRLFDAIAATMSGRSAVPVTDGELDSGQFSLVQGGYFEAEVDAALREVRDLFGRRGVSR